MPRPECLEDWTEAKDIHLLGKFKEAMKGSDGFSVICLPTWLKLGHEVSQATLALLGLRATPLCITEVVLRVGDSRDINVV